MDRFLIVSDDNNDGRYFNADSGQWVGSVVFASMFDSAEEAELCIAQNGRARSDGGYVVGAPRVAA